MIKNIFIDKDDSDSDSENKIISNSNSFEIKSNYLSIWDAITKGVIQDKIFQNTEITNDNISIIININNDAVMFERIYNRNIQRLNKIWLDNCIKEQKKCLNMNLYNDQFQILTYQNVNIWIKECYNSSLKMWNRFKMSKLYNDNYSENILAICEYFYNLLNSDVHEWIECYWIKKVLYNKNSLTYNSNNYEMNISNNIKTWQIEWKKIRKRHRSIHFQYISQTFTKFYRFCSLCNKKLDMTECKCQNNNCNILEILFPILKKQWYTFRCLNNSGYKMFSSVIPNPFVNSDNETQNFIYKSIQDMNIFIMALIRNDFNI